MLPSASLTICCQHTGDICRLLASRAGPPPGLEQLQLDNDVRFTVRQMKRKLANELGKVYPELLHALDIGVLGTVAASKVMSACPGAERNSFLDVIVLTLAEDNRCGNRADFDDALKDMFGEKLDAVWRSRFYNSVYHALRVHGIPCFSRKKTRSGAKKLRIDTTGPMIPGIFFRLGGAESPGV